MDMELSKHDIIGLIEANSRRTDRDQESPSGNFPHGRTLEEYRLEDRRFLQVAWDNGVSWDTPRHRRLNSYHLSEVSLTHWYV